MGSRGRRIERGTTASPAESLVAQWMTVEGRSAILQLLRDMDIYTQIVDATEPVYAEFEKTQLMAMYQRVAKAIREVDSTQARLSGDDDGIEYGRLQRHRAGESRRTSVTRRKSTRRTATISSWIRPTSPTPARSASS